MLKNLKKEQKLSVKNKQDTVETIKHKIISLWLHFWLRRIGKKYPEFFKQLLSDLLISDKAYNIMIIRYIKGLTFKEIPDLVNIEERQVYKIHQKVIDLIINI